MTKGDKTRKANGAGKACDDCGQVHTGHDARHTIRWPYKDWDALHRLARAEQAKSYLGSSRPVGVIDVVRKLVREGLAAIEGERS